MSKLKTKIIVGLVIVVLGLPLLNIAATCPVCGGRVVKTETIMDNTNAPSKNLSVWNRSICANLDYGSDSIICTRCWLAHSKMRKGWERACESADSFQHPLRAVIRDVPLPTSESLRAGVVFTQNFTDKKFADSLDFWCVDSESIRSELRAYCATNGLRFSAESNRIAGEIYVSIQ